MIRYIPCGGSDMKAMATGDHCRFKPRVRTSVVMGRDYITTELADPRFAPHVTPISAPGRKLSDIVDETDTL